MERGLPGPAPLRSGLWPAPTQPAQAGQTTLGGHKGNGAWGHAEKRGAPGAEQSTPTPPHPPMERLGEPDHRVRVMSSQVHWAGAVESVGATVRRGPAQSTLCREGMRAFVEDPSCRISRELLKTSFDNLSLFSFSCVTLKTHTNKNKNILALFTNFLKGKNVIKRHKQSDDMWHWAGSLVCTSRSLVQQGDRVATPTLRADVQAFPGMY